LPIQPFLIVFVLDLLLFLIPTVLIISIDYDTTPLPLAGLVLFPLVHALLQTVGIGWAIYPKATSNSARPSLYSSSMDALPWQSYVICGIGSYLTGALILLIFRVAIPMHLPIVLPTLLSSVSFLLMTVGTTLLGSVSFLLMTVGMSILIDLRLLSRSLDFKENRMRDGAVMGLVMLAGTAMFQLVMFYVSGPVRLSFLVLSGMLGFVMGYFVPATTAAYLQKTRLWARQLDLSSLPTPLYHDEKLEAAASVRLSPQI
jgi:hypothetical protein